MNCCFIICLNDAYGLYSLFTHVLSPNLSFHHLFNDVQWKCKSFHIQRQFFSRISGNGLLLVGINQMFIVCLCIVYACLFVLSNDMNECVIYIFLQSEYKIRLITPHGVICFCFYSYYMLLLLSFLDIFTYVCMQFINCFFHFFFQTRFHVALVTGHCVKQEMEHPSNVVCGCVCTYMHTYINMCLC